MSSGKKDHHSHAQVSPLADTILTGAFFGLVAYTLYGFATKFDDGNDVLWFIGFCACVFVAIRSTEFFTGLVFRDVISKHILNSGPHPHPLAPGATFTKFVATMWQFVIHLTATALEAYLLWNEPWLSHPYTCFIPLSYTPKMALRLFYILQLAIWIVTCFSHRFNSDAHAHKDYIIMYIHHLATIGLVAISYYHDQTRVGLVVLFIHDCSDIGIDLLKLSNYLSIDGFGNFCLLELSYGAAMAMWFYFRLWYYPVYVIWYGTLWAVGWNGPSVNGHPPALDTVTGSVWTELWWVGYICSALLILLFIMHIWWFFLLARIFIRMAAGDERKKIGNDEYEGDHADVAQNALKSDQSQQQTGPKTRSQMSKKVD